MSMIAFGVVAGVAVAGGAASAIVGANAAKSAAGKEVAGEAAAEGTLSSGYTTQAGLEAPSTNLGFGADQILANLYGISNPMQGVPGTSVTGGINGPASGTGGNGSVSGPTVGGAGGTAGTPGATVAGSPANNPNFSSFYNSPGYQYAIQQAGQTTKAAASAGGNAFSTNTLNAVNANTEGVAGQQYSSYVNQLLNMAQLGQTAVGQTVGAAGSAASGIASAQTGAGVAAAGGITGAAGAISGGISTAASGIAGAAMGTLSPSALGAPNASGLTPKPNYSIQGADSTGLGYMIPGTGTNP